MKLKGIITTILVSFCIFICFSFITADAANINSEKSALSKLEKELQEASTEITNLKNEIESKDKDLIANQIYLKTIEAERDKQYEDAKIRIKYMYEYGQDSYLEVLFKSDSIATLINNANCISTIVNYDKQKINQYNLLLIEIQEQQETIELEKKTLEVMKEDCEQKQSELRKKIENKKVIISQLSQGTQDSLNSSLSSSVQTTYHNANNYGYSDQELDLICAIVAQECSSSYEGALAVITCALNRCDSSKWSYLGKDPLSQLCAKGQFTYSIDGHYKKRLNGNYADYVKQAVLDGLNGTRNHNYLSFRSSYKPGRVNIGGNWYFNPL